MKKFYSDTYKTARLHEVSSIIGDPWILRKGALPTCLTFEYHYNFISSAVRCSLTELYGFS